MNNEDNVISIDELRKFKILSDIERDTGFNEFNSNVVEAVSFAIEAANAINTLLIDKSMNLFKQGLEPYPCFNAVCEEYASEIERFDYCKLGHQCWDCPFQMLDYPPSDLDYEEGTMPSHQKALDLLVEHGLLKKD